MYCRTCKKEIAENAEVCIQCGSKPWAGSKYCQNCGAETGANAEVCIKCGVRLRSQAKSGKDWLTAFCLMVVKRLKTIPRTVFWKLTPMQERVSSE